MKEANDSSAILLGALIVIYFIYCVYDSYTTINSKYYSFLYRMGYTLFDSYDSIVMFITLMIFSKSDATMPAELCGTWINKMDGEIVYINNFSMNKNVI